jgi:predicted TIM-barrel fold metal-dependent hydrolase
MEKIWANSGDSHFLEPPDLFERYLPADMAERMPKTVKDPDGTMETVYVDGKTIRRPTPRLIREGENAGETMWDVNHRPPGALDSRKRLDDLNQEGIWGEVCYPSLGFWSQHISDPKLAAAGAKALNDWTVSEILEVSTRFVPPGTLPLLVLDDALAELRRCAGLGFKAIFLPCDPPGELYWNAKEWEPLWDAAEEENLVVAFHVGTDRNPLRLRNPGGAVFNYVETTYGGQRAVTQMIACGALDRHPTLRVLVSEGGATWAPFLGDRMNEGYRQHGSMAYPKLKLLPKEYIYRQVYASFQHDESAVPTVTAMGYDKVLFGSDYPHTEGTFGHTQETLRHLFDGVDTKIRDRMTRGAFLELFPHVGEPPVDAADALGGPAQPETTAV